MIGIHEYDNVIIKRGEKHYHFFSGNSRWYSSLSQNHFIWYLLEIHKWWITEYIGETSNRNKQKRVDFFIFPPIITRFISIRHTKNLSHNILQKLLKVRCRKYSLRLRTSICLICQRLTRRCDITKKEFVLFWCWNYSLEIAVTYIDNSLNFVIPLLQKISLLDKLSTQFTKKNFC